MLKIGRGGGVKDRGGGCQISDDREGSTRGEQAALCGERLSGAMACGRENGDGFLSLCHRPDRVNTILCPRETEQRKGQGSRWNLTFETTSGQNADVI